MTTSSSGRSPRRGRRGRGTGRRAAALAARLEKRIPVAAGLGGGSVGRRGRLRRRARGLGRRGLDATTGAPAAAAIGSDVPFFLVGGPALVEGRGERVTRLTGVHGHPGRPARHAGRRRPDAGRVRGLRRARGRRRRRLGPDDVRAPRPGARQRACRRPTSSPALASSPRPTTCSGRGRRSPRSSSRCGAR